MGPATSREQIGEQIGDDYGLQIHPNPTIVANNVVSLKCLRFKFPFAFDFFLRFLFFSFKTIESFCNTIYPDTVNAKVRLTSS